MGIVSYAQNFEDVMLWRALGHVNRGFYLDIGAQHPIIDSVSRAFYERGWRGIHVEPTLEQAAFLRADRPDETVIQAVVSHEASHVPFYEIPGGGLSTAKREIAQEHQRKLGCAITESLVSTTTLDSLLALTPGDGIHWMKIDVEGYEREVLTSWREAPQRPWIIVVESTYPNSPIDTSEQWQALLLNKGYVLTYRDGLNRYFVSSDHPELQKHFILPPNVFDDFQLNGTATSLTQYLNERFREQLSRLAEEKRVLESELTAARSEIHALRTELGARDRALISTVDRALAEHRIRSDKMEAMLKRALTAHLSEEVKALCGQSEVLNTSEVPTAAAEPQGASSPETNSTA